jgi:hypothetical protein
MADGRKKPVRTPTSGWHEIASGDIGEVLNWEPGYELLEHAESVLGALEELRGTEIDWEPLLKGLPRFSFLPDLFEQRQFSFQAWDQVDGFHVLEEETEDVGSMSGWFTFMRLEMDHDRKQEIYRSVTMLVKRLEAYPPLKPYL